MTKTTIWIPTATRTEPSVLPNHSSRDRSLAMRAAAKGSRIWAVPTWTATAPRAKNFRASAIVLDPPHPHHRHPDFVTISSTLARAMGRIAGPE